MNLQTNICMKKILIYIFTVGIIVSGCTLGPDFQKPDYQTPDNYRFDSVKTDSIVNLYWWKLFDDPILDTLIAIALRENKDVLIAAARIEAARVNVGYTSADQ